MQNIKQRVFEKILKNNGYILNRTKGDHLIYIHTETHIHIAITAKEVNGTIAKRLIKENNLIIK